jgi:predicted nucleotidyltransferase
MLSIEAVKLLVLPVLRKHGVKKAGLFGSLVRGEAHKRSDVDILVEIDEDISLLDFVGIKQELEKVLKRKVDLLEYAAVKPRLRRKIQQEEIPIL